MTLAARIDALLVRWGNLAVVALGAFIVLFGLGGTGLWEPWEMDRAALARNLILPPEVVTALAPGDATLTDTVTRAAAEVGGVARAPDASVGVEGAVVRAALDRARGRVVAAIVLDRSLILPDAARPELFKPAGRTVAEALRYAGGGSVVVLSDNAVGDPAAFANRLLLEKWRDFWDTTAPGWGITSLLGPEQLDQALAAAAARDPDRERLAVIAPTDGAALSQALQHGADAIGSRALFKDRGDLQTTAPLDTWLRALTYRVLGTNEFATRLPGALMAILALFVLVRTMRALAGPRPAFMAGFVLATTPLFFGQARIASGEAGLMLGLTLVGCGLLLRARAAANSGPDARELRRRDITGAVYLGTGLLVGLLADGLFALLLFTVLAGTIALVTGARTPREWAPVVLFGAALALVWFMVDGAVPGSFASQLTLKRTMFSAGPTAYFRNFDLIIHELGFGLIPWSPLVVVAIGAVTFNSLQKQDARGLVVAAWFFVPVALLMVTLKNQNHFVYTAAPAAALAVGMLGEGLLKRPVRSFWVATAALMMFYIIRHEVKETAEPMVSFLTFDPPFSKDGDLRFPADLEIGGPYRWLVLGMALAMLAYFGRFATFLNKTSRFLARKRPYVVTLSIFCFLVVSYVLGAVGSPHSTAMGSSYSDAVGPGQGQFVNAILTDGALLPIGGLAAFLLLAAGAYLLLAWRKKVPALSPKPRLALWGWAGALAIWGLQAIVMLVSTDTPSGYWGEVLTSAPSLAGYVAVLGVVALIGWVTRDRLQSVLAGAAVLAYLLALRLDRDAHFGGEFVILGFVAGAGAVGVAMFTYIVGSLERWFIAAALVFSLIEVAFIVPLIDRWTSLSTLVNQGGEADTATFFLGDGFLWVLVGLVVVLAANRPLRTYIDGRFKPDADTGLGPIEKGARFLETGPVFLWSSGGLALLCALIFTTPFQKKLAVHVSQKHIIEAWFAAEPDAEAKLRIFKHGSFGGQSDRDTNYYTAEFPEIRDRQAALKTLLGAEDQLVPVDTPSGSEWRILAGWSALNDKNNDRVRDASALRGNLTGVSANGITDSKAKWPAGGLVGKRLVDVSGRAWPIIGNDATSLTVDASTPLSFGMSPPPRTYYVIDAADSGEPRASADKPERRALLIPTDDLSEINYAFRQISGGRHLPILDGSSYRVLLAVSSFGPNETQQNRFANATYSDATFAALKDVKRVWGNFEDTIQVVGYKTDKNVAKISGSIKLTVYFKTLKPVRKSLELFLHADRDGGGSRLHGDHWPLNPTKLTEENKNCNGCFRTDHWLPGDIVEDTFDLEVPEDSTAGNYMFYLGFYSPGPDTRLKVVSWDTKNCKHDGQNRLGIGTFTVR